VQMGRFQAATHGCCTRTMRLSPDVTAIPSRPLLLKSPTASEDGTVPRA
jgi:hypothetical protein